MGKNTKTSYLLLISVLIVLLLAAVVIAQAVMNQDDHTLLASPSPKTEESSMPSPAVTETSIPTQELTFTPTPTPTLTPTPLPIIDKIDESLLTGLGTTVRGWYFENPPASLIDMIERNDGIFKKNVDKKIIYLTIDEGYENGYTSKMLDTLKEKKVKTIFFVTESYVKSEPELVKRMVEEGHLLGNHTKTHPSMPEKSVSQFIEELVSLEKQVEKLVGYGNRMVFYRPPKGEYSERDLNIAKQMGYKTVFWSFAYRDWETDNQRGEDFAHDTVIGNLHDGMVLLLHAVSKDNADALGRIIDSARALGYEFRRIDE